MVKYIKSRISDKNLQVLALKFVTVKRIWLDEFDENLFINYVVKLSSLDLNIRIILEINFRTHLILDIYIYIHLHI